MPDIHDSGWMDAYFLTPWLYGPLLSLQIHVKVGIRQIYLTLICFLLDLELKKNIMKLLGLGPGPSTNYTSDKFLIQYLCLNY